MSQWRLTEAVIDRAAIVANAQALGGHDVIAVVKADAYGHGATAIAEALCGHVGGFAVSMVEEGLALRAAGVTDDIIVMGPVEADAWATVVAHDLSIFITRVEDLDRINAAAASQKRCARIELKVDTGMGRLGVTPDEVAQVYKRLPSLDNVSLVGMVTHLACADTDDPDDPHCQTNRQLDLFDTCLVGRPASVMRVHAANTAATLRFSRSRYDKVRCGLGLYGGFSSQLQPAMHFTTRIAQIRDIAKGDSVSYGAEWVAARDSRIAVLCVGYADGLARRLTGQFSVLIRGRRYPVVGRICMDLTMVDITDAPFITVGDEVLLLGSDGKNRISMAEWAQIIGYSEYEVTCGVSKRVPRMYK